MTGSERSSLRFNEELKTLPIKINRPANYAGNKPGEKSEKRLKISLT